VTSPLCGKNMGWVNTDTPLGQLICTKPKGHDVGPRATAHSGTLVPVRR
jgi:hypothetical protein